MASFFLYLSFTLFIVVSVLLILIVLIQKGRGGGLSSAFGGAGGNTAFGSKTGDVLTWATSIMFGIFLLLAIFLNRAVDGAGRTTATAASAPMEQPLPAEQPAAGDQHPIKAQPNPAPAPADAPVEGTPAPAQP